MSRKPFQHEIDWSRPCEFSPGLVAWWPFVGWQGSSVVHNVLRRDHGALVDMAPSSDWVYDGRLGGMALDFDGTNDDVNVPHAAHLNAGTGDFTVAMWIYAADANQAASLFSKRLDSGAFTMMNISIGSTDGVGTLTSAKSIAVYLIESYGGNEYWGHTSTNVIDGKWHHIAIVRSSTAIKFYVDSVLLTFTVSRNNGTGAACNVSNSEPIIMGSTGTASHLTGRIADARYWKRQLGAGEIYRLWHPRTRWADLNTLRVPVGGSTAAAATGNPWYHYLMNA